MMCEQVNSDGVGGSSATDLPGCGLALSPQDPLATDGGRLLPRKIRGWTKPSIATSSNLLFGNVHLTMQRCSNTGPKRTPNTRGM